MGDHEGQITDQPQIDPDFFAQSGSGGPAIESDFFGKAGEATGQIYGAPLIGEIGGDERIAFVRSSVASYWRGRVYDTFDPAANGNQGLWYSTITENRRLHSIFAKPDDRNESNRYLQTWFVQEDLGSNILTGYVPLAIAVPRDNRGRVSLTAGSTY